MDYQMQDEGNTEDQEEEDDQAGNIHMPHDARDAAEEEQHVHVVDNQDSNSDVSYIYI